MDELEATSRRNLERHLRYFGWLIGGLTIEKLGDRHFQITVGSHQIHVVNPNRWRRYRWGIPRQLRRLAHTYGATQFADVLAGKTALDIGANIGEFSLYASSMGAIVIAIEPDRTNLDVLKINLQGKGVRIVEKALWSETKDLTFFPAPLSADSSLIPGPSYETTYVVPAVRLDDLTAELGLGEIFFIKGDAEGAEPEVLTGARATLERTHYVALDCGMEREGADTVEASRQILSDTGFAVELLPRRRTILFGSNKRYGARS